MSAHIYIHIRFFIDLLLNWQAIRDSQETAVEDEIRRTNRRRQPERSRGQRQGVHDSEIDADHIDCDALDSQVEEPPPPPSTEGAEAGNGLVRGRRGTGSDGGGGHDSPDCSAGHAILEAQFFEPSASTSKKSAIKGPAPLVDVRDVAPNKGRDERKGGLGESDDSIRLVI